MQMLINEEGDTSAIERQQMKIEKNIVELAASRDTGEPKKVAAASESDDWGPYGWSGGW